MKGKSMLHFYLPKRELGELEYCFNVETSSPLNSEELSILRQILAEGFVLESVSAEPATDGPNVVELGPRMNFATAYSTNLVAVCHACGLKKITRIERSRRHLLLSGDDPEQFISAHHDRMTEQLYERPLETFETGIVPEAVFEIPLKEKGPDALLEVPGLSMDAADREFYWQYFVGEEGRNPTNVEIRDLDNANSEHSRHGYFKGRQIIDGQVMPETLMEIVQSTLKADGGNSLLAYKDNSSGILGYDCWTLIPLQPGKPSAFEMQKVCYHIIFTAESHNFPSGISPRPGAETGTGGRLRDGMATGRGAFVIAGAAGYCVANPLIPGYDLPWEDKQSIYPSNMARPLEIEIEASNGASDYGNKFGEPVIQGFTRSFDLRLPNGERWAWIKPIMYTSGVGQIDSRQLYKGEPEKGMLIVRIGGPAYRIGVSGGSASSKLQGDNVAELDFNAVQRGDAEMEQKMYRVVRACAEMGEENPIVSIHDQGAGGPANVLKELVEKAGGKVELRRIKLGDPTLSVLEIWVAEYQEGCGLLIWQSREEEFKEFCARERVKCEILGEVTGDGRFVVHDEQDNSTPVNFNLAKVLSGLPQKTFRDERISPKLKPFKLPDVMVRDALCLVFRNLAVGSKRFLTNKVDRSVTGLVVRQPCCGPMQLPVSDVAVVAQSHFGLTGAATSIGEQPIKMLVNPAAGARMAVGEALTNLVWAQISKFRDIKCSANWMWAPKLPGEGAALYDAALGLRALINMLGLRPGFVELDASANAVIRGKDSLAMATRVGQEIVKSPRELVIYDVAPVPNITKVVTPDIKRPGRSKLVFVDISAGRARLGGSALAQAYGQIGDVCPDVDDAEMLKSAFLAVQELISKDFILAGHDVSDGGLITTLLEMAFAGNCGLNMHIASPWGPLEKLFAEELGLVLECDSAALRNVLDALKRYSLRASIIGEPTKEKKISLMYNYGSVPVLSEQMCVLREWWEETSYQIERLQMNTECADAQKQNIFCRNNPTYYVRFKPDITPVAILERACKPEVAILREEGSNGDREMTSAFYQAGFKPWDINMDDLVSGRITSFERFMGLATVGGFSFADVPESAKGWAATIRFNEKLRKMFQDFYNRPDTFSLDVCNGCQLSALLGWVPWLGIPDNEQPRFVQNASRRFESQWTTVRILESPAIMFKGMEGSVLGIWVAHGEGRFMPNKEILTQIKQRNLVPLVYVDDMGMATEQYPFNPNGSPFGIAALCTPDGRHLAMMPHPERAFLKWQWPWMPERLKQLKASPWLRMFQNARVWCDAAK